MLGTTLMLTVAFPCYGSQKIGSEYCLFVDVATVHKMFIVMVVRSTYDNELYHTFLSMQHGNSCLPVI